MNTNEGAEIKCCVCGARPYSELSLPEVVREDFGLMKLKPVERKDEKGETVTSWVAAGPGEGEWRCSQHHRETMTKGRFEVTGAASWT
jgi:hypothetical protein